MHVHLNNGQLLMYNEHINYLNMKTIHIMLVNWNFKQ